MPTDFSSTDNDPISTDSEGSMFAPIPSWERGKKRRSFGGGRATRVAPEPRSFAAELSADPEVAAVPTRPVYVRREEIVDAPDTAFAATPVFASSTARRGNGAAPLAIAAGVILLGGLAATAWYATQPHDQGMAALTPGEVTTTTTATTPGDTTTTQAPPPAQVAQNITPAAPAARAMTTTTTTHSAGPAVSHTAVTHTEVARARPAASRSASDVAADAGARAPAQAAPMPAPTPAPAAAPPAPPLVLNLPAQPAPTSAPTSEAAPQTPPTQTPPN